MYELRFNDWREFQSLCRYWMQHLVHKHMHTLSKYAVYGNEGEGQGGVDLIGDDPSLGVVGQSKCWNKKVLTWAKIQEELEKTQEFQGPIKIYVILTTALRHSSVQQNMPGDLCTYNRQQGEFQVRIFYWGDLQNLDFIPREELQRAFPRLFSLVMQHQAADSSFSNYARSLDFARTSLPSMISQEHLDWLAEWDYTLGYVPAKFFDLFVELDMEIERTRRAIKGNNLREFLMVGYRLQLSQCLPAADPVFEAIEIFAQAIRCETISEQLPDGSLIYKCGYADALVPARITYNWKIHADAILVAYRQIVYGMYPS